MHSETCAIFPLARHACTTPSGTVSLAMPISEVMVTESTDPMETTMTQTQVDFEELLECVTVQTVECFSQIWTLSILILSCMIYILKVEP